VIVPGVLVVVSLGGCVTPGVLKMCDNKAFGYKSCGNVFKGLQKSKVISKDCGSSD